MPQTVSLRQISQPSNSNAQVTDALALQHGADEPSTRRKEAVSIQLPRVFQGLYIHAASDGCTAGCPKLSQPVNPVG